LNSRSGGQVVSPCTAEGAMAILSVLALLLLPALSVAALPSPQLGFCGPPGGASCEAAAARPEGEGEEEEEGAALLQARRHTGAATLEARRCGRDHASEGSAVDVFVMLSLTTVSRDGTLVDPPSLLANLSKIKETGARGIMVDMWWGITERKPKSYDFSAYRQLFDMCKNLGLEVQIVTSFHQCCNKGDDCYIPLPRFVRKEKHIWFKNALGDRTKAYISLFADDVEVHGRRTPLDMYRDWLAAFKAEFDEELGCLIVEVMLGLGTDGELKYPSYQNPATKWTYPGIGMFQAFDRYALASLQSAAKAVGKGAWGEPPDASVTGDYNSFPEDTKFFKTGGRYETNRGKFFLRWYSQSLINHGTRMMEMARMVLGDGVRISGKIAGVHWWYKTPSHAAELNAGYYNANGVDGYAEIAKAFAKTNGTVVDFTCLEMSDTQPEYASGPQELVLQVQKAAELANVPFTGENALSFYDANGYEQMVSYKPPTGYLKSVTYLRISDVLLEPANLATFTAFVRQMADPGFVTPWSLTEAVSNA